ncbi:MAG: hypothetical protein ACRD30_00905, partial [Bryobacteraceae bacterium]
MKRRSFLALALTPALVHSGFSQTEIGDDTILRAMRDELDRSRQLRVVGGADEAPYYIGYTLEDSREFKVMAEMGAVIAKAGSRFRTPTIVVRLGSYDFDQTGHIYTGYYSGSRLDGQWPLDDDYQALRDALWLSTDHAYKAALESMARKRASLNNASTPPDRLPDFSRVEPVVKIEKAGLPKLDEDAWTARVSKLSAVFNAYPEVQSSGVLYTAIEGVNYMTTSEGTALRYPDRFAYLYAKASGQAPDGMFVHGLAEFPAIRFDQLPPEAEIQKAFTDVAQNITALVKAPVGEAFSGPALF